MPLWIMDNGARKPTCGNQTFQLSAILPKSEHRDGVLGSIAHVKCLAGLIKGQRVRSGPKEVRTLQAHRSGIHNLTTTRIDDAKSVAVGVSHNQASAVRTDGHARGVHAHD